MIMRKLFGAAAIVLAFGSGASVAQEPVIGGDAAQAPAPAASWASRCVSANRKATPECSIIQRAVTKTGQLVGAVEIRFGGETPLMVVTVPLGFYIGAGVTIDVDGTSAQKLNLETCDRNGCYADLPLPPEAVTAMQAGQKLNVAFQNMNKQTVTLPMSLIGFTAAYDQAK